MTNLFLKAARNKWRFQTNKGLVNVEQLFDLPEQALHDSYVEMEKSIQSSKGLLGKKGNKVVEQKLDLIEEVFEIKVSEKNAQKARLENAVLKEKIKDVLAEKETDGLKSKSVKELRKMLDA